MLPAPQGKWIETTAHKWMAFVNSDSIPKTQQNFGRDLHRNLGNESSVCLWRMCIPHQTNQKYTESLRVGTFFIEMCMF